MNRSFSVPCAFLLTAGLCLSGMCLEVPNDKPALSAASVDQLFDRLQAPNTDDVFETVGRLAKMGRTDGGAIASRLEEKLTASKEERTRLACARGLCQLSKTEKATPALADLVEHSASTEIRKLAGNSIALAITLHGNELLKNALTAALKNERDDMAKISLARSHMRFTKSDEGRDVLKTLLTTSPDSSVRDEAALVLAENGQLSIPEVRTRLFSLFAEPTERGERALNLLKRSDANAKPAPNDPAYAKGLALMQELVVQIRAAYPDEKKIDYTKLFQNAAKGMVKGLDPFSQYMEPSDVKHLQESLHQDYAGIGAFVGMRDNAFIITSPIFKSPAYEAGLRALDVVVEIDGIKVASILETGGMNSVIDKLKGKPGSTVILKYKRRGFGKPIDVSIIRQEIKTQSVFATMFPGEIAYIRLIKFGERSADEMRAAVNEYVKKQNAKGLVFDLRDNGGGLLKAGVEIADLFLSEKKLIVYSEGRKEFAPRKDFFSTGGPEDETLPMVVLVNGGTASASEIVSGALQDHKRAPLIGEKTFGKGSVQQILDVHATSNETKLRLTIAKYYLPSGRSIHETGIEPDIAAKPREGNGWIMETMAELRRSNACEDFVRNSWEANKELFCKLAQFDGRDCNAWPGFEAFYTGLKTTAPRDDIRAEIRYIARHLAQEWKKSEFTADLEEDKILQRGVFELLKKCAIDPSAFPEYKDLPQMFKSVEDVKKDEK
ncbi:MAG: S41 family peptidase [Planctomycetota bacterium]